MKTLFVLLFPILFSCDKNQIGNEKQHSDDQMILVHSKTELIEILEDSLKRAQLDLNNLKILSKEKSILKSSSVKDTTICNAWNIEESKLKNIIKLSVPISTEEWHYAYDVLPCEVMGQIKYKNEIYNFSINAGSWIDIGQTNGKAIRMGYYEKDLSNLFLSQPNMSDE